MASGARRRPAQSREGLHASSDEQAEQRDPNALQFQYAKKDFEEKLRAQEDVSYSIVRPTAFFKSVSGQVEVGSIARAEAARLRPLQLAWRVRRPSLLLMRAADARTPSPQVVAGGGPFVFFDLGEGRCATCNPISEPDLAAALIDTLADPSKKDALWNIGGPAEFHGIPLSLFFRPIVRFVHI